jgi:hypothetical protein
VTMNGAKECAEKRERTTCGGGLILRFVLLSLVDHALNLLLRKTSLVVRDGDLEKRRSTSAARSRTAIRGEEKRTLFDLPVVLSAAETLRMPLASMSKVTSTWGTPRGAGGMPESSNLPRRLLSFVRARSPS